jgi:hypothetical protein
MADDLWNCARAKSHVSLRFAMSLDKDGLVIVDQYVADFRVSSSAFK